MAILLGLTKIAHHCRFNKQSIVMQDEEFFSTPGKL